MCTLNILQFSQLYITKAEKNNYKDDDDKDDLDSQYLLCPRYCVKSFIYINYLIVTKIQ